MRIGMILDAPYPEDGRVTKEATALIDAGHQVAMLCVRRAGEPARETVAGIQLLRVRRGTSLVAKTFWDSLNAAIWRHPLFAFALPGFVREFGVQCLHVHDLPLAGTVAAAARRFGLPWVLDLHENFPAGLQIWMVHKTNPLVRLKNSVLMSYRRWFAYEGRMVREATAVIAVVEEMKQRLLLRHHLEAAKVYVVTNSEWRNFFDQFEEKREVIDSYAGEFVILYLGFFGPHRGVDTTIEAMPRIREQVPNAKFVVVGRGSFQADLEELAGDLGVSEAVEFRGLVPYAEVGSWMRRADVNIVPHLRNEHTDHTVPHKLFQSMLSGRVTLVSSAPPLARIAEETGGAAVFEAGDAEHLADCVSRLHASEQLRRDIVASALAATKNGTYNWDSDQRHLLGLYDAVES